MKNGKRAAGRAGVLLLAACAVMSLLSGQSQAGVETRKPAPVSGMLFVMTNQVSDNQVYAYTRNSDGTLTFLNNYSTQGQGSGADINSQGALLYLPASNLLYVVNPKSANITGFSVSPAGLTFISITPSGGRFPTSLTALGSTLYVLNGGTPNIQGFTINLDGTLSMIPGATGLLSRLGFQVAPSQVSFTPAGSQIVVTERGTNQIDVFPYNTDGTVGLAAFNPSVGSAPFGFSFDANGFLDVTEGLQMSTSSYQVNSDGTLSVVSPSVKDFGKEPSHIVETSTLSPQIAYVSNAGSNTISAYTVDASGSLKLKKIGAGILPANSKAIDMVIDPSGTYLYILTQAYGTITGFTIQSNGGLTQITSVSNLPRRATWGLAGN